MKVLVDTPIWSLALRRSAKSGKRETVLINELKDLIQNFRAALIGPIRQELLSGISRHNQFTELKNRLSAFDDIFIGREDYERAAAYFNVCREKGIQGPHIDFLICSIAHRAEMPIFTTDKDFVLYSAHLPIKFYGIDMGMLRQS